MLQTYWVGQLWAGEPFNLWAGEPFNLWAGDLHTVGWKALFLWAGEPPMI